MIIEIEQAEVGKAISNRLRMMCISFDGSRALFQVSELPNMNIVSQYTDQEGFQLMRTPFWQQPCLNC